MRKYEYRQDDNQKAARHMDFSHDLLCHDSDLNIRSAKKYFHNGKTTN